MAASVLCSPILSCMLWESLRVKPCGVPLHLSLKAGFCQAVWEPGRDTCALDLPWVFSSSTFPTFHLPCCIPSRLQAVIAGWTRAWVPSSTGTNPGCLWGSPGSSRIAWSLGARRSVAGERGGGGSGTSVCVATAWIFASHLNFFQHS